MPLVLHASLALLFTAAEPSTWDARLDALTTAHSAVVQSATLANSTGGRPIRLITLATDAAGTRDPGTILVVAGSDGRHRVGVETAIGLAEKLAANPPDWLKKTTLRILPCLNPDAFEYPGPKADSGRLRVPTDADHDGRTDEDGGEDLDGDGIIAMMRVRDPAPSTGLVATLCEDPDYPQVLRNPDAAKGERATFAVLVEGIDNDGDGQFNEDGVGGSAGGGLDLDMQWPSFWPEFTDGAGKRPLQTPETLALARWCIDHPEIVGVVVLGRHDTLVSIPEAGKFDTSGQVPTGIENDDKAVYELLSARFKEITGINESPKVDTAGSLLSWAYTNLGVPALGTPVWVRPDLVKPEKRTAFKSVEPAPGDKPAGTDKPADAATPKDPTAQTDKPTADPKNDPKPEAKPEPKDEDSKWVKYFNERVAAPGTEKQPGFIPWKAFNHPQLGPVEIGGFIPGARLNPPADELPKLIDQQAEFLTDLASKLPVIEHKVWATRLAPGLWRIELRLTNTGRLPTHLAMEAKARRALPTIANLDVDAAALQAGRKSQRTEAIAGSGGTFDASWTVRAADGTTLKIKLTDPQIAPREIAVPLIQSPAPAAPKPTP